jgi:hypothetical protein
MYLTVRANRNIRQIDLFAPGDTPMEEVKTENVERSCQAVSPNEPCDYPATVHCAKCGRWFCDAHAEDEEWHPCMLPRGDEGGES